MPTDAAATFRAARHLRISGRAIGLLLATGLGCTSAPEGDLLGALPPCTAGEANVAVEGCEAGIPEASCGDGFAPDGNRGCDPVLPAQSCAAGELATPGDASCHAVAECADGTYGDIPTEADTQHVDAAYVGSDSDGSAAHPWTRVSDAVAAAADGAIVAVAEGSYDEDVVVTGKSIRLWGRCPALVSIVGTGASLAALTVAAGADGTEIRGLALTGAQGGVRVEAGTGIVLEGLWIHDCLDRGITLQPEAGPVSVGIQDVLVDRATVIGIQIVGATAALERVVVRNTNEPDPGGTGQGIVLQPHGPSSQNASATLSSSVVELNHSASVLVQGSELEIDASVVRDTLPSLLAARDGVGVLALVASERRSRLTVRGSVIERNYARGIAALGADVDIHSTHVRDTYAQQLDSSLGEGIAITDDQGEASTAAIADCLVERSRQSGILVRGSSCTLRGTRVRDTEPRESDRAFGRGLAVLRNDSTEPATSATVQSCAFENNRTFGIWVADATVTVDSSIVEATMPQMLDGGYGDGIGVATLMPELGTPASLGVQGSRLESNARGGVATYGAVLSVQSTTFECNAQSLYGTATYFGTSNAYAYTDGGGNVCACGTTRESCELAAR